MSLTVSSLVTTVLGSNRSKSGLLFFIVETVGTTLALHHYNYSTHDNQLPSGGRHSSDSWPSGHFTYHVMLYNSIITSLLLSLLLVLLYVNSADK